MNTETVIPLKKSQEIIYWKVTDLWKDFCEEHNNLLNKTWIEYSFLLSSNIDKIEECLKSKSETLKTIQKLDDVRCELIKEINQLLGEDKIKNVNDLINMMEQLEIEKEQKHLFRFNELLLNLIDDIQTQNKKNQLFINKALGSLQFIREDVSQQKKYSSYNSQGAFSQVGK